LHAGISIEGDAGFTQANGVVGGLGTSSQPYIIEGWELVGISISGTTAYFIIRNVYVHNGSGITLQTRNGQIANSTVKNNSGSDGIDVFYSTNIIVDRNNVSFNKGGIGIGGSDLVTVSANNVLNNRPSDFPVNGITIGTSTRVTVRGNHLTSNDIVPTGSPFQLSSLIITPDNTVNGKPVNYYYGCNGTTVSMGSPQDLIFAGCTNIHVTKTDLSGTGFGIQLLSVNGADLSGDTFSNNIEAMRVYNSTGVTVSNSNLSVYSTGIEVSFSSSITIQGDNITGGDTAILVQRSNKVAVRQNHLAGGVDVVRDIFSNITIANNLIAGAARGFRGNDDGIFIEGNRSKANITDNSIMNNGIGIYFCACDLPTAIPNGTISGNIIQNNGVGIYVSEFAGTFLFNVNVTSNDLSDNDIGVKVYWVGGLHFYHNNFISNAVQASDQGSVTWDNGYPSGGNYWSDFAGKDNCSGPRQDICPSPDGIADTQYLVGGNTRLLDSYPLMKPFGPPDTIQPSWPAGSQVSASSITQTSVTLSWTAAVDDTGILSYRLYNGTNLIATVSGGVHSFQVSGLMPGTNYAFKVEAVDAWGNTSTSDPSTTVKTSITGPGTGSTNPPAASLWQLYWPLIVAAGVAGVALASLTLLWKRRKLRDRDPATKGAVQSTIERNSTVSPGNLPTPQGAENVGLLLRRKRILPGSAETALMLFSHKRMIKPWTGRS
jgi:nitrous oxidase accessory protein NosD